jgi:hypothetical protein
MILHKEINARLRAGALVMLVEEADELLALESAKIAAKNFLPVVALSAADPDAINKLENQKTAEGTLIISDFLRVFGGNPVAVRLVREIALQQRADGKAFSRLILIEVPGVEVPASLKSDIEYITPPMPDVTELKQELSDFAETHDVKIEGNGEGKHEIACAVAGLPRHEAAKLFSRCFIEKKGLDAAWLRKEKAARVSERLGGALTFVETDVPDVGGLEGLRSWLDARRDAFGSETAKKFGLPEPKGVLLLGIPGTGKSLTAKVVAKKWGVPLLRFDVGKVFGSLVGQSESQMRSALESAEACSPCVLWLDEIEKGLSSKGGLDGGTSQRVFGSMLTWLQDKTKPVFVVATANKISDLPPELLRKGRFDEIFFVDLPTLEERAEIARIHLKRHERDPKGFSVEKIAAATEGFSGAEIEQAVIDGLFTAFARKQELTLNDILDAARGTTPLSKTMAEDVRALRAWSVGRAKPAAKPQTSVASDDNTPRARRVSIA